METRSRHGTPARTAALTTAALTVAAVASAALWVDNVPTSVAAGGDFERSAVSLRLPAVEQFPLVAGGWGARSVLPGSIRGSSIAFQGVGALEIEASARRPAHAIQDVPLGTRSFTLRLAVQRIRGRQALLLVDDWDRGDPSRAGASLRLDLSAAGLTITTPRGQWRIVERLQAGRWFEIGIVADARDAQTRVSIDGTLVSVVPGVPDRAPRTVIIGGDLGREDSLFRYDAIELLRLAEVELSALRDRLLLDPPPGLSSALERLDYAAQAIEMGAPYLAIPEIRASARAFDEADPGGPTGTAALALIDLLEAR